MQRFFEKVVRHKRIVVIIFAAAFFLSLIARNFVNVDYDMNDYLPEDSASTIALEVMEEEYNTDITNARVMIAVSSVAEGLSYKEGLLAIDGVEDVTWLDDAVSITQPLEIQDTETVETYYKDGQALYLVTIEEDKRTEAVNAIREYIGDENAMTGSAVSTALATESTVTEIAKIALIAVIFIIFVLILTTESFTDPFIVLIGLGVAVVINMGTNLIFGTISFVTNAAGSILQLAVSLDYSVFLLHRYMECKKQESVPSKAMVEALCGSVSSILSSGLTTVIGFLALCLMQFQIGPDLGLALAKGIALSLITVFVFMPVLILLTERWGLIERFSHRPFVPKFRKFGRGVYRCRIFAVIIFLIILVPSFLGSNANSYYFGSSHIFETGTSYGDDTKKIESIFGKSDTYVLLVPKSSTAVQKELSDALHELPEVTGIISYVDTVGEVIPESYLEEETLSLLNSENYTRMVISVNAEYEGEETFALVETIRGIAEEYYPGEWYLAGEGVSTYDLMNTVTADMTKVNLIAIGAVFAVLLLSMKSAVLPVILVLSIETAIWLNLANPYFTDQTIFYIAYLIISSIQLGATVDYAILFTDTYREKRQLFGKKNAVIETVSSTLVSILTSGSVLTVVGFLLGYISTHGLLAQLGMFLGKGTICSLIIVLFVLPGFLVLFDPVIVKEKVRNKNEEYTKKQKSSMA